MDETPLELAISSMKGLKGIATTNLEDHINPKGDQKLWQLSRLDHDIDPHVKPQLRPHGS